MDHLLMAIELLPNFTGDPNSARDILEYLTDPTNAGLLDLDQRLEALTAIVGLKVEHARQEAPPTSATAGWLWTKPSTGVTYYCHTTYDISEPAPDLKWTAVTDGDAVAAVKAISQINSPTPQVGLLSQTISGMSGDGVISAAEKATVNILWDEMVQKKIEIDLNAVRYNLTGDAAYTDYVTSYNALSSYITTLGVFVDLNSSTTLPDSNAWNVAWNDALTDEGAAIAAIRSASQALLDTIDSNVNSVQAQLDEMTADGIISPAEKLRFRDEWVRIQDEYTKLSGQATEYGQTGASQWTTLAATYSALATYLGTTTSVFSDMSTSTTLANVGSNATEWQAKWQAYYTDAKVFDAYIDTYFKGLLDTQDATLQSFVDELQALADDGVISGGSEKQTAKRIWLDITRLHSKILYQAGKYSVATPAAYTTAYDALNTYLNTTLSLFTDMSLDTAVTRAVYNSKFDDYYFQYDSFTDLVVDAQETFINAPPADYEDYKALVDAIVDDGIISAGMEKTRFNAIWLDIQATHSLVVASGSAAGANTAGLSAAYDDLSTYIGSLTAPAGSTPNFTIEGEDTAIGVATFYSKMRAYEAAKAQLESDIINQLIELQAGNAREILDINDDGIVSVSEKNQLYKEWNSLTAEKAQLDAQADLLSITTEKTNMDAAYTTLETYLNSLAGGAGLFNDLTTATTLTTGEKANWDTNWNNFFNTKATLETTIIATIQGNTSALGSVAFKKDGSVAATGNFDMANNNIQNLLAKTLAAAGTWAATTGQLYTEQQARIAHEGLNVAHGTTGTVVGTSDIQTLTNKVINADSNTLSEIEVDNFKAGVVESDVTGSTTPDNSTVPSTLATKTAITNHSDLTAGVHGTTGDVVGTTDTQTLTNKTLDASLNTLSNVAFAALTGVKTSLTPADHTSLATSLAIKNYGDANWGGGGGGGGGAVDLEWVTVGNAETANTGTNAVIAEGTLTLPAGKKWKYVRIVFRNHSGGSSIYFVENINRVDIDLNNDTANFVFGNHVDTATPEDNAYYTLEAEGVPSITDQDITVKLYAGETSGSVSPNRSAYIVGIAAGDPQATEEFGVYADATHSGATTYDTPLLGTRIDVTDPEYANSSFSLSLSGNYEGHANILSADLSFNGLIKKQSGGDPFARISVYGCDQDGSQYRVAIISGSLSTSGASIIAIEDSVTAIWENISQVQLERVDSSNELCFRLSITHQNSSYEFRSTLTLAGPKSYNGTDITSANGTLF